MFSGFVLALVSSRLPPIFFFLDQKLPARTSLSSGPPSRQHRKHFSLFRLVSFFTFEIISENVRSLLPVRIVTIVLLLRDAGFWSMPPPLLIMGVSFCGWST